MKKLITLLLLATLVSTNPAQAAFVVRHTTATIQTQAPSSQATTIADAATPQPQSTDADTKATTTIKNEKKGYGALALLLGILGGAAIAGAILLIPASLIGALLLALLGMFLGVMAIGSAETDKKSIAPQRGFAVAGKILGIFEALPVIFVYVVYLLCGGMKHERRKKEKKKSIKDM